MKFFRTQYFAASIYAVFLTLTLASSVAMAEDKPRQLYAPIDHIYSVEEARNLSLYKRLVSEGVNTSDLDQPNSFVETYSDSIFGMHKYHRTAYIPPELRNDIQVNTIIGVNRHDHTAIVHEVIPRSMTEVYNCIEHNGYFGIAGCTEDAINKSKSTVNTVEQ